VWGLRDDPRAISPRYRSRHCKFPTRFQLSRRDPRLYIIYSYFHAAAGFYRETRYSVFPRVSSSRLPTRCIFFFSVYFSFRMRYPRSPASVFHHFQRGKRRLRKILSAGSPSLSPTTKLLTRVSLFLSLSLSFSFSVSLAYCLRERRVLCKQLRGLCRIRTVYISN